MGRSWRAWIFEGSGCKPCAVLCNLGLADLTLQAVENDAVLFGCLHELEQVSVILLGGMTVFAYIILYSNYALSMHI